jgi:hypothetical protein
MLSVLACNSNESSEEIKLNDGEKWEVNAEMRPFIEQGNVILTVYIASGDSDYQLLTKYLKTQNAELISSCTMKGESHDELHKWLPPHIALIEKLANSENAITANYYLEQLKTSFDTYNTYFK